MRFAALILLVAFAGSATAELGPVVSGMRPGYLVSVKEERHWREVEMVLLPGSRPMNTVGLPLVDKKLSREFEAKYEQRFGRTAAERNLDNSSRYSVFEDPGGKTESVIAHTKNQRKFGEFMFRRLSEHHVDKYAKSNPDIRPMYELKDRIQNVSVEMKKGYKMRLHYSLSGNYIDAKLENPYDIGTKLTLEMRDGGFGPGKVERTIVGVDYPWSKKIKISAFQEFDQSASTSLVGARQLGRGLTSTLTLSQSAPVNRDEPRGSPRHDLVLVGLSWSE